jgi:hypothetical protein
MSDFEQKDAENIMSEADQKLDEGYRQLANDPEYQADQRHRKVMRGVIRRRSALKLRWPDS